MKEESRKSIEYYQKKLDDSERDRRRHAKRLKTAASSLCTLFTTTQHCNF
jgi:hypothetical protein